MQQFINGHPETTITCVDRGLQYGDGLFETIAVRPLILSTGSGYRIECWQAHWQRLAHGLKRLGFEVDEAVLQQDLLDDISALLTQSTHLSADKTASWVIKVIITRGAAGRGYQAPITPQINRIVQCLPWPLGREKLCQNGVSIRLCQHHWSSQPVLAGLKHLNRLDQVIARSEWRDDYHEGLMLNQQGHVQSGVMSNVFVQLDNQLYTPSNDTAGIDGIMAQQIKHMASLMHIPCSQQHIIPLAMLHKAQGLFLTNSLNGICPVVAMDKLSFPITELTDKLQQALGEHIIHQSHEIHHG